MKQSGRDRAERARAGKRVVVIAGANVGLGSALAAVFLADSHVVALGRAPAIADLAAEVPEVVPVVCELTEAECVERAFGEIERTLDVPDVVIYNAHRIELRSALETTPEAFAEAWRVGCFGAFLLARRVLPGMRKRGAGALFFTGATSSLRAGKRSAAFGSAKFALRGLAQSLAREFGPEGIHVAHVVIDGLVWSERSRLRFGAQKETAMEPHAIATTYRHLAEQEPSAWTHELDLRPRQERF
jgi:NAD(P)-dependent dehydrogenase (short-subunit alcohol dehydrogenase family)